MARAILFRWKSALTIGILFFGSLTTISAAPRSLDEGDDQYRFLVGLIDKEMYDMAAEEGTKFLRDHPRHEKVTLARYRLATELF